MDRRPLDALFFDIDDTLFSTTTFARTARKNAVKAMCAVGLRLSPESVSGILDGIVLELSSNSNRHYDTLLERVGPDYYAPVNPAIIIAAGIAAYHDTKLHALKPYDDAKILLKDLSALGARLGVVSAGLAIKQAEKLVRLGLVSYLDPAAVFITRQMEMTKKDPAFYKTVSDRMGLLPERCMMVGDNPIFDIDPPREAGWIAVHIRRPGSKHYNVVPKTKPDYEIFDFAALREILSRDFDLLVERQP